MIFRFVLALCSMLYSSHLLAAESLKVIRPVEGWDNRFYRVPGNNFFNPPGVLAGTEDGQFLLASRFSSLAGVPMLNLARWDGTNWMPALPGGEGNVGVSAPASDFSSGILALETRGNEMVIGGSAITNAGSVPLNNIGYWNGTAWNDLGGGINGRVTGVLFDGARIWAGGSFTEAGGVPATNIAVWNGKQWEALGAGLPFVPEDLAVYQGEVFAAADRYTDLQPGGLLKWNGASWTTLAGAFTESGAARSLLSRPEGLYVGGYFSEVGGVTAHGIALWNGTEWKTFSQDLGENSSVSSLAVWNGQMLAAGTLTLGGGADSEFSVLGTWNGSEWNLLKNLPWKAIPKVAAAGTKILGLGKIRTPFRDELGAMVFDGSTWTRLGHAPPEADRGAYQPPRTMLLSSLPEGVSLTATWEGTGSVLNRLATWTGRGWTAPEYTGFIPGSAFTVVPQGELLWLLMASGVSKAVYVMDGTNLVKSAGAPTRVYDLAAAGKTIYAGTQNGLAVWNGSQWGTDESLISTGAVSSIAFDGNYLYVAEFNWNGYTNGSGYSIAKLGPNSRTVLAHKVSGGAGPDFAVPFEIKIVDGILYAYGNIREIDGKPVRAAAKWDGAEWQPVVPIAALRGQKVWALTGDGRGSIYLAGDFVTEGATPITNLVRVVDGAAQPLANDLGSSLHGAEWWRGSLYVAGQFQILNGVESRFFGAWHDPEAVAEVLISAPTNVFSGQAAAVNLRLDNFRKTNLTAVEVVLVLPENVTVAEVPENASRSGTNLVWNLSDVQPGETILQAKLQFSADTNEWPVAFRSIVRVPGAPEFVSEPVFTSVSSGANLAPEVRLHVAEPPEGFSTNVIDFRAEAADADGSITQVEFYANEELVGTADKAPYRFVWANTLTDDPIIRAVAVDNSGQRTSTLGTRASWLLRPIHDHFADAHLLTGASFLIPFRTGAASTEPNEPGIDASTPRSVWYVWDAPATGTLLFSEFGIDRHRIALWQGKDLQSLESIASTPGVHYSFPVRAGERYYLQLLSPNVFPSDGVFTADLLPPGGRVWSLHLDPPASITFFGAPATQYVIQRSTDLKVWLPESSRVTMQQGHLYVFQIDPEPGAEIEPGTHLFWRVRPAEPPPGQ